MVIPSRPLTFSDLGGVASGQRALRLTGSGPRRDSNSRLNDKYVAFLGGFNLRV